VFDVAEKKLGSSSWYTVAPAAAGLRFATIRAICVFIRETSVPARGPWPVNVPS
jgi:hypothetical protein